MLHLSSDHRKRITDPLFPDQYRTERLFPVHNIKMFTSNNTLTPVLVLSFRNPVKSGTGIDKGIIRSDIYCYIEFRFILQCVIKWVV